jgi:hypothetical protein
VNNISKILTTLAIIGIGVIVYGKYKTLSNKEKTKLKNKE